MIENALKNFKSILGDSLVEMNDLRSTKLVAPKIDFNLSPVDLQALKRNTDCDFLINIGGNIVSDGAGTLTYINEVESTSNSASVSIAIYDLNSKTLISSSQVFGKIENQPNSFGPNSKTPTLFSSADMIMLTGAKKLIKKYEKNQLKK